MVPGLVGFLRISDAHKPLRGHTSRLPLPCPETPRPLRKPALSLKKKALSLSHEENPRHTRWCEVAREGPGSELWTKQCLGNDNGHVTRSQDGTALLSEFFPQTFPAESQEADGALTLRPLLGAISHSIPWRLPGPRHQEPAGVPGPRLPSPGQTLPRPLTKNNFLPRPKAAAPSAWSNFSHEEQPTRGPHGTQLPAATRPRQPRSHVESQPGTRREHGAQKSQVRELTLSVGAGTKEAPKLAPSPVTRKDQVHCNVSEGRSWPAATPELPPSQGHLLAATPALEDGSQVCRERRQALESREPRSPRGGLQPGRWMWETCVET